MIHLCLHLHSLNATMAIVPKGNQRHKSKTHVKTKSFQDPQHEANLKVGSRTLDSHAKDEVDLQNKDRKTKNNIKKTKTAMQINEALDKIIDWTKNQRAHEMKSPKANDEGLENRKNCHFFT